MSVMSENASAAVIVISSHVVRGSVGNRAAVFALETLGHPVWALPTIVLPWHPGHGRSTRLTFAEADFDHAIDDLIAAPWLSEPDATAEATRDQLTPLASLATPNRYELAWLAGAPLDDNNAIMEAALALGPSRMLVTSAVPMMTGGIGNLYLSGKNALLAEHRAIDNAPNGLGDLLSAV